MTTSIRAASSYFEARSLLRQNARPRRVALGALPQSLGEDGQAKTAQTASLLATASLIRSLPAPSPSPLGLCDPCRDYRTRSIVRRRTRGRSRRWKWVLILVVVLLLIPAMPA